MSQKGLWERHCGQCARDHSAEIQAMSPVNRNKGTMFDPYVLGDPELEHHLQKVIGPRMLREGRLEIRKNEGGGFS